MSQQERYTDEAPVLTATAPASDTHFCYKHPTVETSLRCNKCGQYICARCAVPTPVGYRCKTCVHQQQDIFYTARSVDYVIAAAVGLVLGGVICFVLGQSLFFAILLAIPAGGLISEICHRLVGKRRGRYTGYVLGGAVLVGAVIAMLPLLSSLLPIQSAQELIVLAGPVLAGVLCAGAAAGRFALRRI